MSVQQYIFCLPCQIPPHQINLAKGNQYSQKCATCQFARGEALVTIPVEMMARVGNRKDNALSVRELGLVGQYVLSGVADKCLSRGVRKVEKRVEEGRAAEVIADVAKAIDADMIVMGSRGLSDVKRLVFGSVSHEVAHADPCTLVIVQ